MKEGPSRAAVSASGQGTCHEVGYSSIGGNTKCYQGQQAVVGYLKMVVGYLKILA
jgi:hypothetical protein